MAAALNAGQWGTIEDSMKRAPPHQSRIAAPGTHIAHAIACSARFRGETDHGNQYGNHFQNRHWVHGIQPRTWRRHRSRFRHAYRGRTGYRQINAAAGDRRQCCRLSAAQPERNTVLYISGEESQAQVRMRPRASARSTESASGRHHRPVDRAGAYRTMQACAGHRRFRANHRLAGSRWHLRRLDSGARSGERADRHRQNA